MSLTWNLCKCEGPFREPESPGPEVCARLCECRGAAHGQSRGGERRLGSSHVVTVIQEWRTAVMVEASTAGSCTSVRWSLYSPSCQWPTSVLAALAALALLLAHFPTCLAAQTRQCTTFCLVPTIV